MVNKCENLELSPPRLVTASETTEAAVISGTPTGPGLTGVEL